MSSNIDVYSWILSNYKSYDGPCTFLHGATDRTTRIWNSCKELLSEEEKCNGVLSIDTRVVSSIASFDPGYIDRAKEIIVGIQTDKPLKRACKPRGGIRMVESACSEYGYDVDPHMKEVFTKYAKTHNAAVFDVYTPEMKLVRSNHLLTGLPDAYGRGRIIGDYRRVALFGVDALIEAKENDKIIVTDDSIENRIRIKEEIAEQIRALKELKVMAQNYGHNISLPASNSREAIQWTYFAYLAATKEQDGAAMSLGRLDCFFDIYIERNMSAGKLTELEAQELIDDFTIKLRLIRHLRTPQFNELFSGNPTWITLVLGGINTDNHTSMVTKTTYRFLQSLRNLGAAPEPNLTILWSQKLPAEFKSFCGEISILTSSIQFENDDLMSGLYGSDYGIACCVSPMKLGKEMQFFGARCNLPKLLLYCLNQGRDEITGKQVGPTNVFPAMDLSQHLSIEDVKSRFLRAMDWLTCLYSETMNTIHYMHDKYNYERLQMALHDTHVTRCMAYGIAGLSIVADSLSAIEFGHVKPVVDDRGIVADFKVDNNFPRFGNDLDEVDRYAVWVSHEFMERLRKQQTYRNSIPTMSVLTITSNVVYGNHTGSTPDGRQRGTPFAPGANPMHCQDKSGALASLNSVCKLSFVDDCRDGISNTFSILPLCLGKTKQEQLQNFTSLLDGYFHNQGHHININVMNKDTLTDAIDHPEKYPQLTIRVSGYAVLFNRLTQQQKLDVISRTFHGS